VGDGSERPRLTKLVRQLQIGSCLHFLGTHNDLPELLSVFDLFLLTSGNEANPVSILETMSYELPVVATNVGSISETVKNRATDFLIPPDSAEALSQRVIQLLSHSGQTEEMSQRGYQAVVTVCHGGRLSKSYLQDLSVQGFQATRQRNASAVDGNSRLRGRVN